MSRPARKSGARTNPGGKIMVELGDGQAAAATDFSAQNWIVEAIRQDYSPRDRFLLAKCS